jgi:hypothetical protein
MLSSLPLHGAMTELIAANDITTRGLRRSEFDAIMIAHGRRFSSWLPRRSHPECRAIKRLDPEATCNDLPPKPNGKHWSTYDRLADKYQEYDNRWAIDIMRRSVSGTGGRRTGLSPAVFGH